MNKSKVSPKDPHRTWVVRRVPLEIRSVNHKVNQQMLTRLIIQNIIKKFHHQLNKKVSSNERKMSSLILFLVL